MVKIGSDFLILDEDDIKFKGKDIFIFYLGISFGINLELYQSVKNIIFINDKTFMVLKSVFDLSVIGMAYEKQYNIKNYSTFLFIYYLYVNSENNLLECKDIAFKRQNNNNYSIH